MMSHSEIEESIAKTKKLEEKYSAELASWSPIEGVQVRSQTQVVLLTGASGVIGSLLLDIISKSLKFSKVYALVRGPDQVRKIEKVLEKQGVKWDQATRKGNVEILEYIMGDSLLGLDRDTYRRLSREVTTVVQNAWDLDFRRPIEKYEEPYLKGE